MLEILNKPLNVHDGCPSLTKLPVDTSLHTYDISGTECNRQQSHHNKPNSRQSPQYPIRKVRTNSNHFHRCIFLFFFCLYNRYYMASSMARTAIATVCCIQKRAVKSAARPVGSMRRIRLFITKSVNKFLTVAYLLRERRA